MKILYEDEYLVVCVKPSGVVSEDNGREDCMPYLLRQCVGGEIAVIHRLDREVGGVMVYSKNSKTAGALMKSFSDSGEKHYLTVVSGVPEESGMYEDLLLHDSKVNKTYVVKRERKGVRKAKLLFERLGSVPCDDSSISLVRVQLLTGRTHQIRVQFASRKMPVAGDARYGSRIKCGMALFSYRLSFLHPVTGESLSFSHLPEKVFPFSKFEECLLSLT